MEVLAVLCSLVLLTPPLCNSQRLPNPVQDSLRSLEKHWREEFDSLLGAKVDAEFIDSCGTIDFTPGCKELGTQGEERAFLAISENQISNLDQSVCINYYYATLRCIIISNLKTAQRFMSLF